MGTGSSSGRVTLDSNLQFDSVKVFSATMMEERAKLGSTLTQWLQNNPQIQVTEVVVTQSSDNAYHCFTLTVFFRR